MNNKIWTLLHIASRNGHLDAVQLLVDASIAIGIWNVTQMIPLSPVLMEDTGRHLLYSEKIHSILFRRLVSTPWSSRRLEMGERYPLVVKWNEVATSPVVSLLSWGDGAAARRTRSMKPRDKSLMQGRVVFPFWFPLSTW